MANASRTRRTAPGSSKRSPRASKASPSASCAPHKKWSYKVTMPRRIAAADFKARCLALLDEVDADGIIITKHGKPVAKLVPIRNSSRELIGCLKGKLKIEGDVLSTGVRWNAES
jgi:prevent-host-death family protein